MAGMVASAVGLVVGGIAATDCWYTVDPGHRAVIFSRLSGVQDQIYEEGLHFKIPWLEWPLVYDIRQRPHSIVSPSGSKDLQTVNLGIRTITHPNELSIPKLARNIGQDFDNKILPSLTKETLKSIIAQYNASQLITMRNEVSAQIKDDLERRCRDFFMVLDDVAITELSFSPIYIQAVESKQIAQQDAQRASFIVEKAHQERQEKIVKAEGEAKAAQLIGDAVSKNPAYLKLQRIDIAKDIAKIIGSASNRVFLDNEALMLNVFEDQIFNKSKHMEQRIENEKNAAAACKSE